MSVRFLDAQVYEGGVFVRKDVLFPDAAPAKALSFSNCFFLPGFADVHVHLREPGFSYKETIASGTRAAAHGGYTAVCPMPNLKPVPDSLENLQPEMRAIAKDAVVPVYPYGAITKGERGEELADLEAMAPYVCAFSDDGRGVQDAGMMEAAMRECRRLGKLLAAHCEDNSLLSGGCIHDGPYARAHGHKGISSESEWRQVERDLQLAEKTGCKYHVCHVSTKESVTLVRAAKKRGADVSCETGPHYLTLTDAELQEDGRFKMNPPVREKADRDALIEGILDGTIDCIATDHAPHSAEEKSRGLEKSLMGVVGLETAFPILYTKLVLPGIVPLEKIVELLSVRPRERFGLPVVRDFSVFDVGEAYTVDPNTFLTMGRATPFAGERVYGKNLLTVCAGRAVWCGPELTGCFEGTI
jgi:dihydroorotase